MEYATERPEHTRAMSMEDGKKLYFPDEEGGITFRTERKIGEVRIANYVYDLWLPILGAEALGVYAVYCRLERAGTVRGMTQGRIAKLCRMGKDKLAKVNERLEECGFVRVQKPEGAARLSHRPTIITTLDPPQAVAKQLIDKHCEKVPYEVLSFWLVEGAESRTPDDLDPHSGRPETAPARTLDPHSTYCSPYIAPLSSCSEAAAAAPETPRPPAGAANTSGGGSRQSLDKRHGDTAPRIPASATPTNLPASGLPDELAAAAEQLLATHLPGRQPATLSAKERALLLEVWEAGITVRGLLSEAERLAADLGRRGDRVRSLCLFAEDWRARAAQDAENPPSLHYSESGDLSTLVSRALEQPTEAEQRQALEKARDWCVSRLVEGHGARREAALKRWAYYFRSFRESWHARKQADRIEAALRSLSARGIDVPFNLECDPASARAFLAQHGCPLQ